MYPNLWKFDKNEKFNPIQCQPGPKVVMTFYKDRAISKMSAQNLSHLSNLESHCAKESAELRRGDREGHYGRCLTHFQIRAKEYATLMDRKGKGACLEH